MLVLPQGCVEEIIAHANEEYPKECCGIAIGVGNDIREVLRGRNILDSPYEYIINPEDTLRADKLARERQWDIIAFYHSHTAIDAARVTEAYPSKKDIKGAQVWPAASYLIVSLADRANPDLRGFRIQNGQVTEEELEVVSGRNE